MWKPIFPCLIITLANSLPLDSQQEIVSEAATLSPGQSYNVFNAAAGGSCVSTWGLNPDPGAQAVDFSIEKVESTDEVRQMLAVNAAGSSLVGLTAGVGRTYERSINSYSTILLLRVQVINQRDMVSGFALTQPAKDELDVSYERFLRMCGTGFVAGYVTGGEFAALLTAAVSTEQEKTELEGRIRGAIIGQGKGAAELSRARAALASESSLRVRIIRRGPSGRISPVTPGDLIDEASGFPLTVRPPQGTPWKIAGIVLDYTSLDPRIPRLLDELAYHTQLRLALSTTEQVIADLEYALANRDREFQHVARAQLTRDRNRMRDTAIALQHAMRRCALSLVQCTAPRGGIRIPEVPVPGRVDQWKPIRANSDIQCLGYVYPSEPRVFRLEGTWSPDPLGRRWRNPTRGWAIQYLDATGAELFTPRGPEGQSAWRRYRGLPYLLPAHPEPYQVCVKYTGTFTLGGGRSRLRAALYDAFRPAYLSRFF